MLNLRKSLELAADRERCPEEGMDEYISKPILADQLASIIDRSVGVSAAADASDPSPAEEALNIQAMLARVDGDVALLRYIIELYIEDLPKLSTRIRCAVADLDCDGLERAAHSLKGLVSNFDAYSVVAAALRLEDMGREGNLAGATEALSTLERELEWFEPALIKLGDTQADESSDSRR
jgi:two-component system, sensor histidine kinase and response regulator